MIYIEWILGALAAYFVIGLALAAIASYVKNLRKNTDTLPIDPMKYLIKKILPRFCWSVLKQTRNFSILARSYGQFQTIRKGSCIDREGNPIPWYTYPAIEYLSHLDFSDFKVMEYGGNSTLWWSRHCADLVSVEHDAQRYEKIKGLLAESIDYHFEADEDVYVQQNHLLHANVVVIDGAYRSKCADWLVETIRSKSHNIAMLIFDNSDWYPKTIKKLNESLDWVQADFHGFSPINAYISTTSIFINPASIHTIKYRRPLMPIRGIYENSINNMGDVPVFP